MSSKNNAQETVASGLNINGCVFSYFEGTANLRCYTSCTLTTLHCSKVSFLQYCHMKRYKKNYKNVRDVLTSVRYCTDTHICIHLIHLIPFGVQTFFDGLASKELIADQQHAIGVRLPFDQSTQICILNFQILSFKKMNP